MMEHKPLPEGKKGRRKETSTGTPARKGRTSKSWWNRNPFQRKEKERRNETSNRTPASTKRNQEYHDETERLSWGKKEERRRGTSTGTKEERIRETSTGTPRGTSKSWWNRTSVLRKERIEKKGDKHRNQRRETNGTKRNQQIMMEQNPCPREKKEERRRETSTGTPAGTKRNQQILMEQNPFPQERKKREEGRQAPEL